MDAIAIGQGELIDWAVAARALPGEKRSGDLHLVEPFPAGVLVAAVDGLGHGDEAAQAAQIAVDTLIQNAHEPPLFLVRRCHERLMTTRGVAMSVAAISGEGHTMSWLGVGNVEGSLFRRSAGSRPSRESLLLRGGVVGYQLPKLLPSVVPVDPGDTLVFVTDGIGGYPLDGPWTTEQPARIAEDILARFARGTDDALVLVA